MSTKKSIDWQEANQRYLMAAVKMIREELELYQASSLDREIREAKEFKSKISEAQIEAERAAKELPAPAAIETLVNILGLSTFERNILLLCAGVELDAGFGSLVATLQGGSSHMYPSFSLALAAFPGAHWSALSPNAPLRYWHLLTVDTEKIITRSPLRIDEHILHYLAGVHQMDERLREMVEPVFAEGELVPTHRALTNQVLQAFSGRGGNGVLSVIQLNGGNTSDQLAIAAEVCRHLGLNLFAMSVSVIPGNSKEAGELSRLWNREAALHACALFLDGTAWDATDRSRVQSCLRFIENVQGLIILSSGPWNPKVRRQKVAIDVHKPTSKEQLMVWQNTLGQEAIKLNGQLEALVSQFDLSAQTIHSAGSEALQNMQVQDTVQNDPSTHLGKILRAACSAHTRLQVDELAQRIEPLADWEDLVLPEAQKEILKEIAMQVKQRTKVYEEWGFAAASSRGLGISALFTGESGTGKTMASEVLANELQVDLYRIDLSQVVNKYIGETEKNLKRIFDAAEEGGAILLFDEADALFGKRSDVKDSHDRYSNIEVSYLLQRMEAYRGLAILTTNMKGALDKAFLRRIRFVVQFPFPNASQRAEIWRRIFPTSTPTEDLDVEKLARLNIPGGNIKNIALNAAFIAAHEESPVHMSHVSRAARSEYNKLDRSLSMAEIGGWS